MKPDAYTVGHTESYNRAFIDDDGPPTKLGERKEEGGEPYLGGIVFRTRLEASEYLKTIPEKPWSVYGLRLPTGWDVDVKDPAPDETFHRLRHDALLVQLGPQDYYDELSDVLEQHPIGVPGVRR